MDSRLSKGMLGVLPSQTFLADSFENEVLVSCGDRQEQKSAFIRKGGLHPNGVNRAEFPVLLIVPAGTWNNWCRLQRVGSPKGAVIAPVQPVGYGGKMRQDRVPFASQPSCSSSVCLSQSTSSLSL